MAVHNDLSNEERIDINQNWEGLSGKVVEDAITKSILDIDSQTITSVSYDPSSKILTLNKKNADSITTKVTVIPPDYITELQFTQLIVNGNTKEDDVEVNYTESLIFKAGINVKTFYESTGTFYDLYSKVSVTFYIEGTTDQLIVDDISPNKREDNSLQFINITKLFKKNIHGAKIKAVVTANNKTSTSEYPGTITVHKIELNTSSTHVSDKKVVFDIIGLNNSNNMNLEYYDVPLGTSNLNNISKKIQAITNNTQVELELPVGGHQILARVNNTDGTFYSNWIQANIISWDKNNKTDMMAIIGGIPNTINNCENAKLFQIISVPGLGGKVEIISYLADDAGIFSDDQSEWPEFNRTSLSSDSNDEPSVSDYYSYVELTNINNATKVVAFSLNINDINYNLYSLEVINGRLSGKKTFTINIVENPYNKNGIFNHVPGAIEDFSQIKGQSTTLFTNTNSNIEASDGWTIDENLIAYKISGQGKDLFEIPKNYDSLLSSGRGFTIEVMLKNYNINGDDPVMNIGNLLFGPGYTRINSTNEEIYVNSRSDFEKEVITHLMFVYDPAYKPSTYNNIYDQLFNEKGLKYSDFQYTYPILKVYVNGSINREIEVKPSDLEGENGFRLQINPSSSDLNLYIFRTYNWAFNYQEIQKNFISSKQTSLEKKKIYDRNDILGEDGRVSFYKTMKNNNVIVVVLPEKDKPLYFGNRKTNGDGIDPNNPNDNAKATLLVHYKDPSMANANGRFTEGKYKAQGSSAKKYMIHNVQYSKGKFISESDIAEGKTETSNSYALPTDDENIKAKKFVGKVNYASSMQSHKLGSVKLFDKAYKQKVFKNNYNEKLYAGGKKACLEEAFVYFYYNIKSGQDINTITINDLYKVDIINGIEVPQDKDVKFFGFQTWGSGKADDPTFGYGDNTPEYLLVEGADNGSTGTNFKQPWAAFQTWTPTIPYDIQKNDPTYIIQQTKEITDPTSSKYDPTAGLVIDGETIKFDSNGTDPWDIDYGLTELDKAKDLWQFTDKVKAKGSSLHHFVSFYNNCYAYDFSNLIGNPNSEQKEFNVYDKYGLDDHRIYMTRNNTIIYDKNAQGERIKIDESNMFDTYRWDSRIDKWVPGGLHYDGDRNKWEKFNLKDEFGKLSSTDLYLKYNENPNVMDVELWLNASINDETDLRNYIIPAFRDMFKANVEEYCDKEDIIYHQAFIRLVSGTDNRAKNTYFQIIGKLYENGEPTDKGDYRIRLMQDDMDTIFATDNNGQQVKPYYLLEPAFNKDTEKMWGDHHSSFFYPFDICYYKEINNTVGEIIDYLVGSATSITDKQTLLHDYFFKTQIEFPEILYNHHAEIYYEMPQVLFKEGKINAFSDTLSGFANNSVQYPLSLSHGRCIESEYQFMKDRLLLLGTQSNSAHNLYGTEWQLSTEGSGGNEGGTDFIGNAEYTDYLYPTIQFKRSNGEEYSKLVNLTNKSDINIKYDDVFTYLLEDPGIPNIISQLVTPLNNYNLLAPVDTTITSYISSAQKIKSLTVTKGLNFMHYLPNLPNVKFLNINGRTAEYSVNSIDIIVKDSLPIVETLIITNAEFSNSTLDFRNCNRLNTINLQGCIGIKNIILPENNRLTNIYLPNDLKQLSIGVIPNLSVFEIPEGTKFTSISLDCSNFNNEFDYIDILTNYIDYDNLTSFVINNTPKEGLVITKDIAERFAKVQTSNIQKLIKGKFIIKDRIKSENNGEIIYTWGNKTNIEYSTKKNLVKAFGNIDSVENTVYFDYTHSALQHDSAKLSQLISIDVPSSGIIIKPFDGLYFTSGNDISITNEGLLNIQYKISQLPSGCILNEKTGELSITIQNTNRDYNYSITVTRTNGTSLNPITGKIHLGYIEPAIGDFAYSDGTFSSIYDSEKTLVGLVFQKETITSGYQWKLGVVSAESISDYAGPDYYYYDNSSNSFNESNGFEQKEIYNFMTNSLGLGLSGLPSANLYIGAEIGANPNQTIVDKNYIVPSKLVSSGNEETKALTNVGYNRLKTIINKSKDFKNYLLKNNLINDQMEFSDKWEISNFEDVCKEFNSAIRNELNFNNPLQYYKVLHPLAMKTSLYYPENLSKSGIEYYSKGSWYIPSMSELELLIYYRIKSTTNNTTSDTQSYWNSTNYSVGDSIFSDKYIHFESFLNSKMLASSVSNSNSNFVYGETNYHNGNAYVTKYGWFCNYAPNYSWSGEYHSDCRRDYEYTIAPCCNITVTKEN